VRVQLLSKPALRLVLGALAALLLSGGASAQDFVPPKTLTVTLHQDFAPYSFRPENGAVQGIMRDLWDLWSVRTGVAVQYVAVDRDGRLGLLDQGRADVAGNILATDARTENYLLSTTSAIGLDVAIFFDRDISGITGVESLDGFTVGVMAGGNCAEWLRARAINRLREYADWETMFAAAARGEINVFCSSEA
jgi:ABC-type amino acid transport substrate-binding protein